MTGRPRKSEATKDIAGTNRQDRRSSVLPEPSHSGILPQTYPEPPDYLTKTGRRAFYQICDHLRKVDALWEADFNMICKAAFWEQLWEETVFMTAGNTVQTFQNGTKQISPEIQVLDKAEGHIRKYYELLGIGPKARESIGVFQVSGGSETQDPFGLLMKEMEAVKLPDHTDIA